MFVYANLLGTWQELPEDSTIDDLSLYDFADLFTIKLKLDKDFYKIVINKDNGKKDYYYVHKSCIQLNFVK